VGVYSTAPSSFASFEILPRHIQLISRRDGIPTSSFNISRHRIRIRIASSHHLIRLEDHLLLYSAINIASATGAGSKPSGRLGRLDSDLTTRHSKENKNPTANTTCGVAQVWGRDSLRFGVNTGDSFLTELTESIQPVCIYTVRSAMYVAKPSLSTKGG
jgi:hypothetical protein